MEICVSALSILAFIVFGPFMQQVWPPLVYTIKPILLNFVFVIIYYYKSMMSNFGGRIICGLKRWKNIGREPQCSIVLG